MSNSFIVLQSDLHKTYDALDLQYVYAISAESEIPNFHKFNKKCA